MTEVLFNDFINQEWSILFFNKTRFNDFYVFMKRVPIVTNFKRPIYQTFN